MDTTTTDMGEKIKTAQNENPKGAFLLFLSSFPENIRNHDDIQDLIAIEQWDTARRLAPILNRMINGETAKKQDEPRHAGIAWQTLGESYNAHEKALKALDIDPNSDIGGKLMFAVSQAPASQPEKQDSALIKALVSIGIDDRTARQTVQDCRATAYAYANARNAATALVPVLHDDTMAAIKATWDAKNTYKRAVQDAENAYHGVIAAHSALLTPVYKAVNADSDSFHDGFSLDNDGRIIPASVANLKRWRGKKAVMAVRLKNGIALVSSVNDLLTIIAQDAGIKLPQGSSKIAGTSAAISAIKGIVLHGAAYKEGFSFLSHDDKGQATGGFTIISGDYKGGRIDDAATMGNGRAYLAFAKDTDKTIADLLSPVLKKYELAFFSRQGKNTVTAGSADMIAHIKAHVL